MLKAKIQTAQKSRWFKKRGKKIPVSEVTCEFHLSLSFLMFPCTKHLVIQSLALAAPDNGTQQLELLVWSPPHSSCRPQQAPYHGRQALKEVPQGALLPGFGS